MEPKGILTLNDQSINYLKETAKWGKFLAILGFVLCGFMALLGVLMGTVFNRTSVPTGSLAPQIGILVLYIAIGVIYLFPSLYLYRFSTKAMSALENLNNDELSEAFKNHKAFFKFIGVFSIIMLIGYGILLIFILLMGGAAALLR
jgi:type III secretory pathway component EscS